MMDAVQCEHMALLDCPCMIVARGLPHEVPGIQIQKILGY